MSANLFEMKWTNLFVCVLEFSKRAHTQINSHVKSRMYNISIDTVLIKLLVHILNTIMHL